MSEQRVRNGLTINGQIQPGCQHIALIIFKGDFFKTHGIDGLNESVIAGQRFVLTATGDPLWVCQVYRLLQLG